MLPARQRHRDGAGPRLRRRSWEQGYGDFTLRPDLATLRRIPWLPGTALTLADVVDHERNDIPHSPRAILKRQIARLTERGLKAFCASELEFYLFDETYEALFARGYRDAKTAGYYIEDYHVFQTSKEEPVMRAIRNGLHGAGVPIESSKGEWGPGQEEINLRYAEALEMADRHVILKNGVKEIAHAAGKAVTFMAKWRGDLAGSSSHIHLSLWDLNGRAPLFFDAEAPRGMSALMRRFLAGQLAHAAEITYFSRPSQFLQALPVRDLRPDQGRCGASTTAPPAFACAAKARRRRASSAASAAPTSTPISPSRR